MAFLHHCYSLKQTGQQVLTVHSGEKICRPPHFLGYGFHIFYCWPHWVGHLGVQNIWKATCDSLNILCGMTCLLAWVTEPFTFYSTHPQLYSNEWNLLFCSPLQLVCEPPRYTEFCFDIFRFCLRLSWWQCTSEFQLQRAHHGGKDDVGLFVMMSSL